MQNSLLAHVLLSLSVFQAVLAVSVPADAPEIVARQTAAVGTGSMPLQCMEYSRIANLSTIGANSSYRAPFMAASPVGTSINAAMLDAAIAKLPAMTKDQALNDMCGNLTTVALTEAERNLTLRTVAQFDNVPAITVDNGLAVVFTTVMGIVLICGTALAV
ncbi:putative metal tolerance protein 3 protein [Phaeoacremonium minimum UCRPA7]|uniref:Putative metal tolerance protein 3 protein n=1 Tax=Phaeoacremonium minimum (strain UCR-PA7) TaxID=1286976 RepID=R8B8M6_PHAM7|nr:putative metal tolerance protein 3 protein [Phaeoacremonium minimum UCRPA7]EON95648.1 putative metal tolerance protein 3 protein [Phaeoacremonium minimum UCRPA7]